MSFNQEASEIPVASLTPSEDILQVIMIGEARAKDCERGEGRQSLYECCCTWGGIKKRRDTPGIIIGRVNNG